MSSETIAILAILLGFVLLLGLLFYLWAARFPPELPGALAILTGIGALFPLLSSLSYRLPPVSGPESPSPALWLAQGVARTAAQGIDVFLLRALAVLLFSLALAMGLGTLLGARRQAARKRRTGQERAS